MEKPVPVNNSGSQEWFSAKDLVVLPGMPGTDRGIREKAKREAWRSRPRQGRGGGREYHLFSLPCEARDALIDQTLDHLPAIVTNTLPAIPFEDELPEPASLAKWQRETMDARCVILNLVEQLAGTCGLNQAIKKTVARAKNGLLPETVQVLVPVANARSGKAGGKQALSRRTLLRWRSLKQIGVTALAPREPAKKALPDWVPYFLKCYRKPQKPSVSEALEELETILPVDIDMPSGSQCYRLVKKISRVDVEKGRRTGTELAAIRPFRRRGTEDLFPLQVATCDGHTFKAKVAHPGHGRPFQPEVCAVVDVATRRAIGWSAGLSESAETVADALRHAIEQAGIPYIFYTDPGSGNKANVNAHPAFGRYARMGITFQTGRPGNTQGRGLVERFQKSCWIRAAKKLPTFKGTGMDGSTLHKATRLLDKDIRQGGQSDRLISWEQFLYFCQVEAVDAYNNRHHSALPKITDDTGKRRNMTPNEMWAYHISQGWVPETITEAELADLFRPRVQCKTTRGEVRLFGNIYYHSDLKHHHKEEVFVEYEPQDGKFVFVRDLDERLICKAEFNRNKDSYFPVSAIEEAAEKRARRRAKLKEQQLEEIELERRGSNVIEVHTDPKIIEARNRLVIEMAQEQAKKKDNVLVIPEEPKGKYRLCRELERLDASGETLSDRERRFMESYQKDYNYKWFRSVEEDLGGETKKDESLIAAK